MGTINNYTSCLFSLEDQLTEETSPHIFPFPTRLFTVPFVNSKDFEYLLSTLEINLVLLLGASILLNIGQVLFKFKQLFQNTTKRSSPRLDRYERQGVWDSKEKPRERINDLPCSSNSSKSPPLLQIMQLSFPQLGKSQGSAQPECREWALPWENHLPDHGDSPAR